MLPPPWSDLAAAGQSTLARPQVHDFIRASRLAVKLSGRGRPVASVLEDLCKAFGDSPAELVARMAAQVGSNPRSSTKRDLSLFDADSLDGVSDAERPTPAKKRLSSYVTCGFVHRGHTCSVRLSRGKVRLAYR